MRECVCLCVFYKCRVRSVRLDHHESGLIVWFNFIRLKKYWVDFEKLKIRNSVIELTNLENGLKIPLFFV